MEDVKLRSRSGIAKLTGVALCLAGVFTIAFFAGPAISPVNHHRTFASHPPGSKAAVPKGVWIKWTFLMVVANMCWALWIVLQVRAGHIHFLLARVLRMFLFQTESHCVLCVRFLIILRCSCLPACVCILLQVLNAEVWPVLVC